MAVDGLVDGAAVEVGAEVAVVSLEAGAEVAVVSLEAGADVAVVSLIAVVSVCWAADELVEASLDAVVEDSPVSAVAVELDDGDAPPARSRPSRD